MVVAADAITMHLPGQLITVVPVKIDPHRTLGSLPEGELAQRLAGDGEVARLERGKPDPTLECLLRPRCRKASATKISVNVAAAEPDAFGRDIDTVLKPALLPQMPVQRDTQLEFHGPASVTGLPAELMFAFLADQFERYPSPDALEHECRPVQHAPPVVLDDRIFGREQFDPHRSREPLSVETRKRRS